MNEDIDAGVEQVDTIGLLTANGESFLEEHTLPNGFSSPAQQVIPKRKSRRKTVHFKKPVVEEDEDGSDSEDDEDFAPDAESPGSDISMAEDSDESSSDSDDSSSDSDVSSDSDALSSDSDSHSSSADSHSSSDSDTSSDSSSGPEVHQIQHPNSTVNGIPGKGLKKTRSRNHRRRDGELLKRLKATAVLPKEASLNDMRVWQDADPATRQQVIEDAKARATTGDIASSAPARKRKRGAVEAGIKAPIPDGLTELEQRKRELMTQVGDDDTTSLDTLVPAEPTPKATTSEPVSTHKEPTPTVLEHTSTPTPAESTRKRLRPDTSAISRILAHQTQVRLCSLCS